MNFCLVCNKLKKLAQIDYLDIYELNTHFYCCQYYSKYFIILLVHYDYDNVDVSQYRATTLASFYML